MLLRPFQWFRGLVDWWTAGLVDSCIRAFVDSWIRGLGLVDPWTVSISMGIYRCTYGPFNICMHIQRLFKYLPWILRLLPCLKETSRGFDVTGRYLYASRVASMLPVVLQCAKHMFS